jgi:hypothetical protein
MHVMPVNFEANTWIVVLVKNDQARRGGGERGERQRQYEYNTNRKTRTNNAILVK